MIKLILNIFLLSFMISSFSQSNMVSNCDCELALNWKYVKVSTTELNAINTPFGEIYNTDGCETQKILKDSSGYFKVIPFYGSKDNQKAPMWIEKKDNFVTIIPSYFEKTSRIYEQPDTNSRLIISLQGKNINTNLDLVVVGCKGIWLNVNFILNETNYTGWIRKQETCPESCTSCEDYK